MSWTVLNMLNRKKTLICVYWNVFYQLSCYSHHQMGWKWKGRCLGRLKIPAKISCIAKSKQSTNLCCNSYWPGLILIFPQINAMLLLLLRGNLLQKDTNLGCFLLLEKVSIRSLIPESAQESVICVFHCEVYKHLEWTAGLCFPRSSWIKPC